MYAFDVFMQIYENAGWSQRDAAQSIIKNNIYGLDIDDRAAQLSYFAVLMKARQYDRRILTRGIEPNVYAVQESNGINRGQLKYLGAGLTEAEKKAAVLQTEGLLNTLNDAKEYGSMLNVESYDWEMLEKFVENTDTESQISLETYGLEETAEQLKRLIRIGKVMAQKYEVVVTNPPYAGTSNLSAKVNNFVKKNYQDSKADLFAVFIERCGEMLKKNGYQAMITQHAWMFLSSFERLRIKLQQQTIVNMAHLGTRAFEEISGEVVQTTSFVLRKKVVNSYRGTYCRLVNMETQSNKEESFFCVKNRYVTNQRDYAKVPGAPVAYWISDKMRDAFANNDKLYDYSISPSQNITGNNSKYVRKFWEMPKYKIGGQNDWIFYCKGGGFRRWWGNLEDVVDWTPKARKIYQFGDGSHASQIIKKEYWYKKGITWGLITSTLPSFRVMPQGATYDKGGSTIIVDSQVYYFVLALLNSKVYLKIAAMLNPTLNFQVKDVRSTPLVITSKKQIDSLVKSNIDISRQEWDAFETSWNFKKHPLICNCSRTVEDAYEFWAKQCEERFNLLKANEEELNSIFIDAYGLKDELTSEVEDKEITVRKADLQRDIKSLLSYAVGCMFGRYSLDEEGLIYASGEWNNIKYKTFLPYDNNCITITDEEYFSGDIVARFIEFVRIVYGADTLEENLDFIAKALGNKGDTSREIIRNYFLKDFYADHLKVYQKRPIYWLFDSGKQNGFKALIYMHRYDADTVGRVRTDYLHKAQKYVETAMQSAQYTIDNATSASEKSKATKAVTKYTKQLAEMKIYDEAIAHVANQRIEIDLDDGVKVNYAKFQGVEVAQEGKKALKVDLLAKI